MSRTQRLVPVDASLKQSLAQRLRVKGEILRFSEDPVMASLCTCVALEFEVGRKGFDRLSPFLAFEPDLAWEKELLVGEYGIGLRLRRADGKPLQPRHPDLRHLLHASSLDEGGHLTQAVIYPLQTAEYYNKKGFELVIVRDWILATALTEDASAAVPYLQSNAWEVGSLPATVQAAMMTKRQLAFFGTHDIVDHLFGAEVVGFQMHAPLYQQVVREFSSHFCGEVRQSSTHLMLSYLVGIALDDLAQPRWYGSTAHAHVVNFCLENIKTAPCKIGEPQLPTSFHEVVLEMRSGRNDLSALRRTCDRFMKASPILPNRALSTHFGCL